MRLLFGAVLVLVLAAVGFFLWSRRPEIAEINASTRPAFDHALVERGAQLAAIGNCDVCHTARGGSAYAGGRPIPTPFGTIYSSNITPDPRTGIGSWPEGAFRRAMTEGVTRRGSYLYPAFPYDHFAKLMDDDIHALYAFVMTRDPVEATPPADTLPFPLNIRPVLAAWDLLYLDSKPFRPDPTQTAEWNRGAYLVEGLGHCGACHTPRNVLGAEKRDSALAGGEAEGWQVPALTAASPAPLPWDAEHLVSYLHDGSDAEHGAPAGPMQPVTHDLSRVDEADVRAIAIFIASLQEPASSEQRRRADRLLAAASRPPMQPVNARPDDLGTTIFSGACASCHTGPGPSMVPPRGIDLALSSVLNASDPTDAIFIILDGIRPPEGRRGPWMPRFSGIFTDGQIAALLGYLRAHESDQRGWGDLETRVRDIRRNKERP